VDGIYHIHYFYEENMQPPTMGTGIATPRHFCILLLVDHYKCWVAMPTRWVRVENNTNVNHQYYGYLKMVLTSQGPQWRLEEEIVPHVPLDGVAGRSEWRQRVPEECQGLTRSFGGFPHIVVPFRVD